MWPMPNVSLHPLKGTTSGYTSGYGLVYFIRERCPDLEFDEAVSLGLEAAMHAYDGRGDLKPILRTLNEILGRYA